MEKQELTKPTPKCPYPECGAELHIHEPGWYTCPNCNQPFFAEQGHVIERVEWEMHTPDAVQEEHATPDNPPVASMASSESEDDAEEGEKEEEITEVELMNKGEQINAELNLFIPLTKVIEDKQEVWGFAALEEPDRMREILDYATTKPLFLEWSEACRKRSNGQSMGNVRSMHSNIAAGKLISVQAVDARKGFYVGCKVVNQQEWEMVKEGVYTGFSLGGSYVKRWVDRETGYIRYTGKPIELSLVDSPAIPSATFEMVKADGSSQSVPFKHISDVTSPSGVDIQYGGMKVRKFPGDTSPITIHIHSSGSVPSQDVLQNACVPGQKVLSDNPPVQKDAANIRDNGNQKEGEQMNKADLGEQLSQARALVGQISEAPEKAGEALAQLKAIFDVLVDEAPEAQNTEIPADVATAASDRGVTVQDAGSTTVSTQKAVEESSTPGKETPSSVESDTKPTPSPPTEGMTEKALPPASETTSEGENMNKQNSQAQEPLNTTPPTVIIPAHGTNDHLLPAFISALEGEGSLKKAQHLVDNDQGAFDDLFVKAQRAILNEGGWKYENMGRINTSLPGAGLYNDEVLAKAITSTDLPNLYLMRLAKLMLPLYAGLRRRIAANPPPVGAALAQWRGMLGSSNFDFASALQIAEAATGQTINESFLTFQAPFKRSTVNDSVNLEAIYTARGFDDPLQVAVIRALTFLLGVEERKILGDNSGSIAAPASVTVTGSTTGGTLAALTYTARVSALTYYGHLANAVTGSPGGETTISSGSVTTTGSTSSLSITWPAVKGAVAYNLYLDNGTNNRWVGKYYVNKATVTAMPGSGGSHPGSNTTANAHGYEGLVAWSELSTVYSQSIPNKTFIDQAGAGLSTYAGGITEFDTLLAALWTNWQIAPSLIVCSSDASKHLTKQLLSANNPAIYRLEVQQERGTISGGAFVTGYVNKFAPFADGTPRVLDVMAHPYFPNGTYLFLTESIPYPMSREPRGWALEVLIPYTYFPLAQTTLNYPFAMLCSETLECFHPGAQAAIVGVDVTV